MKPTQKQPEPLKNVAVTREDIEAAANLHVKWVTEADKFLERAGKLEELANRLLTERDEAIREVETQKANNVALLADRVHWRKEVEAEKRRAAAYREVAIAEIECGRTFNRSENETCEQFFAEIKKYKAGKVDEAAQKLLADSGGEKEKSE